MFDEQLIFKGTFQCVWATETSPEPGAYIDGHVLSPRLQLDLDLGGGAGVVCVSVGAAQKRRMVAGDLYVVEIRPLARKS